MRALCLTRRSGRLRGVQVSLQPQVTYLQGFGNQGSPHIRPFAWFGSEYACPPHLVIFMSTLFGITHGLLLVIRYTRYILRRRYAHHQLQGRPEAEQSPDKKKEKAPHAKVRTERIVCKARHNNCDRPTGLLTMQATGSHLTTSQAGNTS